ncbi:trans-sulfuration enzyme family protein [Virgibacillus soli]|uniref:trans-sulfuration enzyme family protein n=1 Tax=Paracerasibacillus soli TaxID=480284 RepID=UPI0035E5CF18
MTNNWGFNTKAIHCEVSPCKETGAVSQPLVPAVAYAFQHADAAAAVVTGENEGTFYGRYGNPTTCTLEKKIARLEGAEEALAVSSGMAAISTAILAFVKKGEHIVVTKDIYGGTHKFLTNLAPRFGIEYDYVDCTDMDALQCAIKANTKVVYIETPSNPTLTLIDIEAVCKVAHRFGLSVIVDNTFMTPYLQRPLELGADVVVHSATKYLNGHGDVVAGVICGKKEHIDFMRQTIMGDLGQALSAWDAYLILRGLKTLGIRVAAHCDTAQRVAEFLEGHEAVERVYYPGLASHPQRNLAKRQMSGMGGIIAFEVKGGVETGKRFIDSLKLAMISFSLGDPETLVQHPASMTHSSIPEEELIHFGIPKGLIRLSVGLENPEDIVEDLKAALELVGDDIEI